MSMTNLTFLIGGENFSERLFSWLTWLKSNAVRSRRHKAPGEKTYVKILDLTEVLPQPALTGTNRLTRRLGSAQLERLSYEENSIRVSYRCHHCGRSLGGPLTCRSRVAGWWLGSGPCGWTTRWRRDRRHSV